MGKNSQRRHAKLLESEEDTSSVSSSSSMLSDKMSVLNTEDGQVEKDTLLDLAIDALYEKRGTTREKALSSIIEAFNNELQHEFIEKQFATLLHQCVNSIKKGSSKEISLASHAIGLLALTVGLGDNAHEIFKESMTPISQTLKAGSEPLKTISLLEALAVITFVCGDDPEETERSMEIIWQVVHPKLTSKVVASKLSPAVVAAVVSSWSFLLTTVDTRKLSPKLWQQAISYLSTLLDKDDRPLRIAAGEALALIFEIGSLEKFSPGSSDGSAEEENKSRQDFKHILALKEKVRDQVRNLSTEAGGKGSAKKDLNSQRNRFRDILDFLEDGYCPETSTTISGASLNTSTWSQMIQLNFLKHFLGGGFVKHMKENEFLHEVFDFSINKRSLGSERRLSNTEKRIYRSPNSILNKARTQFMSKQRMASESKNNGHFRIDSTDE